MTNENIIDGLKVIAKRRGQMIAQGDVLIVEAAIKKLSERPEEPLVHYVGHDGDGVMKEHSVSIKEAGALLTDALAMCNRVLAARDMDKSRP